MDGGVEPLFGKVEGAQARAKVDGDPRMFGQKARQAGASQRVPKVGRIESASVPPPGADRTRIEARLIRSIALATSRA